MTEFKEWPKIPRGGNAEAVTITEKIDGSNACVVIEHGIVIGAQSRNRMLTDFTLFGGLIHNGDDNFGFAEWVIKNKAELAKLGDGYHYGEWAGPGIQQNPHNLTEKTFFLFNTFRWNAENPNLPEICKVVPVLYNGPYYDGLINETMANLRGSAANAGYAPEGVVTWFHRGKRYEKTTFAYERGKWAAA